MTQVNSNKYNTIICVCVCVRACVYTCMCVLCISMCAHASEMSPKRVDNEGVFEF